MIDIHCHLENDDYEKDRELVIEKCRKKLRAMITCCAKPHDFALTMELVKKYSDFLFCTCSIHPIYIKEITETEKFFD